ncbi:MAG: ABC transporter ATP-binding protein [Armatimonadetes bacterium]|nr:ABC transporter ATP-binding protein [Armatimonadota bacterium]
MIRSDSPVAEADSANGIPEPLMESPPGPVGKLLREFLQPGEEPEIVVASDLLPDGRYGETWLLATKQRVVVVDSGNGTPKLHHFALADLEQVEKLDFVGSSALRLVGAGETCHVRFSLSQAEKFADVREMVDALRSPYQRDEKEGDGPTAQVLTREELRKRHEARAREKGRCPKCGRTLPRWNNVCPVCLQKTQLLLRLVPYVLPYWFFVALNICLMACTTAMELAPPYLTKTLLDEVFPQRDLRMLAVVLIALFVVNVLNSVLSAVRQYLNVWLQQRIVVGLRMQLYEYLHRLSLSFYDRQGAGHIMQRIMHDTANLQNFMATGLQEILGAVMTICIICVVMFRMDWKLALITLGPVPFIVWGNRWFSRKVHRIYRRAWRQSARLNSILTDILPGMRVVKAFGQEEREVDRFVGSNRDLLHTHLRAARLGRTFYPFLGFLSTVGTLSIWAYGGYLVIVKQTLTPGVLVAFLQYLMRFYQPMYRLSMMNDRIQHVATSAERVFELMDTRPDVEDAPDAEPIPTIEGNVRFENVSFGYDTSKKVLENVSFEVSAGEMIGLVGHSGAGKSTLINLICRFYDVGDGRILIDGRDIRKIKLKSLRDQIGVVLQEPYLFRGTILDNIAYGRPKATRREVVAAAMAANAHEFICQLPDGYDTMIGERGAGLSGGERQRISIARAILRNPRILILDEATASVDTETEAKIREAIERLVKGRTTFAIAHRLSTLRNASRLLVMEKGRVAEIGTHEELLEKEDGVFRKLWDMQADLQKQRAEIMAV